MAHKAYIPNRSKRKDAELWTVNQIKATVDSTNQQQGGQIMKKNALTIFCVLVAFFFMVTPARAGWWMINYIPTADTYYPDTVWPQYSVYGLTNSTAGSFQDTKIDIYGVSFGLPTLKLGNNWEINSDIGIDFYQPDAEYYDETFLNGKVKFLKDGQFGKFTPAAAIGFSYLGGRNDVDAWKYFDADGKYHHPSASHPAYYLVASKWISIPHFKTQLTAGYMWNNFGIDSEDIPMVGLSSFIVPDKLLLLADYYGGDYGNYGIGLFWIISKKVEVYVSYFIPKDKDYPYKDYQSESIWAGIFLSFPLKLY